MSQVLDADLLDLDFIPRDQLLEMDNEYTFSDLMDDLSEIVEGSTGSDPLQQETSTVIYEEPQPRSTGKDIRLPRNERGEIIMPDDATSDTESTESSKRRKKKKKKKKENAMKLTGLNGYSTSITKNHVEERKQESCSSRKSNNGENHEDSNPVDVEFLLKQKTGLDDGLIPEKIIGICEYNKIILHLVKWKTSHQPEIIPSPVLSAKFPQVVISYYESQSISLDMKTGKIHDKFVKRKRNSH